MKDKNLEKILLACYVAFGKAFTVYILREKLNAFKGEKPSLESCMKTIEHYIPNAQYAERRIKEIQSEQKKENTIISIIDL
jgi:hypothetical protein